MIYMKHTFQYFIALLTISSQSLGFTTVHSISPKSTSKIEAQSSTSCEAHNLNKMSKSFRSILKIIPQQPKHWVGDGFNVYPVFGQYAFTESLSPWLMFDYATPKNFPPTKKRLGVGQHPHRGFETITIAFQGSVEHKDSTGNSGVIGPGDVQWMTAGRGIVHEEFHSTEFAKTGGTLEMCQIWLNLPAKHKMVDPRYQPILSSEIASSRLFPAAPEGGATGQPAGPDEGEVRVIAGKFHDAAGPAKTWTQVDLW